MNSNTILEGITCTVEAKTKPDSESEQVKQQITFDFTGCTLEELAHKAAQSFRIDYQNGYARKHPEIHLYNGDEQISKRTIVVKDFFKGRETLSPQEKIIRFTMKTHGLNRDQAIIVAKTVQDSLRQA